jgi:GMC oxidoreductase
MGPDRPRLFQTLSRCSEQAKRVPQLLRYGHFRSPPIYCTLFQVSRHQVIGVEKGVNEPTPSRRPHTMRDLCQHPSEALLEDFALHFSLTAFHPTSTCWIGSVVNPQLRVLGVDRLRVADACDLLGVKRCQVFRLLTGLKRGGAASLVSKRRGPATLVATRHDPLSPDVIRALNLIDVTFVDDFAVREAWSKYYAVLRDSTPAGLLLRVEKRRDLLLTMVKTVNWEGKISTSDILRSYAPDAVGEQAYIDYMERQLRIRQLAHLMHGAVLEDWRM